MSLNTILATTPNTSTNYILKATGTSIGNSTIQDNGTTITLGSALSGTSAVFSSTVDGTIINSTSNAFRLNGNNALSLVTLNSQSVVKINAAGFWGTQLVGANDQGIVINNTGQVGIGTTTPDRLLQISNTAGQAVFSVVAATNDSADIFLGDTNNKAEAVIRFVNGSNYLAFLNGGSERMRITSDGKVGINTGSPQYLFAVAGGRANLPYICSNQFIAGQISGNLTAANAPNYILMFNMTDDQAGWSCAGTINAAAWDCWNISTIWVRKLNASTTVNAGITGLYKSGCDFAICDITYIGKRWIAFRFTSNPEIDVMLTGYGLNTQFNSDGSAQVVYSGVSVNSILASY